MNSSFELVDEYHFYLEKKIIYSQPNLHKTSGLLNIIFVIFTCFFGEEKFYWLPSKNKVADEATENCNLTRKFVCLWKWSSATLFLEGSQLMFSSPKIICQMNAGPLNQSS